MGVTNSEELDLLMKWLGPTSSKYAASIRSSSVSNPAEALRRIWERLNQRYGSPELLESVLMSRLSSFPKLTNKDNVKLYDLLDLLSEIESLMQNPKYSTLLAHFNSSSGIAPILIKLPNNIQEKWTTFAYKYKKQHDVIFPPFSYFVEFMEDISRMKNDPGFMYTSESSTDSSKPKERVEQKNTQVKHWISTKKTEIKQNSENAKSTIVCPLHKTNHSLNDCRGFRNKSLEERKCFVREKKLCFRCCNSDQHKFIECKEQIHCNECGSNSHPSALHSRMPVVHHGGEKMSHVTSACTQICKDQFCGKSCAKVILVNLHQKNNPNKSFKAYAILDDQSNKSLVKSDVFDQLDIHSETTNFQLTSCSGIVDMSGRQARDLTVSSLDRSSYIDIPFAIECNYIPEIRDEIPTPEIARSYAHLHDIAKDIPEVDEDIPILLLIGRDIPEAHHVLEQRTGARNSPFGQRLTLGWVIVGESCLNKVHRPNSVVVNKTYLLPNGRSSIFQPCANDIHIEVRKDTGYSLRDLDASVFMKQRDDDTIGLSVDDKNFIRTMDKDVHLTIEGNWEAPLPFREKRPRLPNNRMYALKRAQNLDTSLRRDQTKRDHFISFMKKESVAVTTDIESMFHCFLVDEKHRNFLRFFWYEDNDISTKLIEYRMRVHVFGNSPSPAVAVYCLRKAASANEEVYGSDVVDFVRRNFYVDDGLVSLHTAEEATSLLKRTQSALKAGGNLRLHKIASNDKNVMDAFSIEDRAKDLKDLDLSVDDLPMQRSLGLNWELQSDSFTYRLSMAERPFSKRGLLSTINGIYDPIGFVSPVVVSGKILMRETLRGSDNWDDRLPAHLLDKWLNWKNSLKFLEDVHIPRTYTPTSLLIARSKELHVFSDASEMVIASVAYLRTVDAMDNIYVGFILGKSKLAPASGHSIPRLELCAAVLSAQLFDTIREELDVKFDSVHFYTDSRVVLGYIHNQTRRFYKYVENRVERIKKSTTPGQWSYVATKLNPADSGTRSMTADAIKNDMWILGPPQLQETIEECPKTDYHLCDPEHDKEIRKPAKINTLKSTIESKGVQSESFRIGLKMERFSRWTKLVRLIDRLRTLCRKHCHTKNLSVSYVSLSSEDLLVRMVQEEVFSQDIACLQLQRPLPKNSSLITLNPIIDKNGLLRLGGRLKRGQLTTNEKHPAIIPKKHHLAILLVRHFHESVKHQGRHFTAGALQSAGYWLVGGKRLISSLLRKCVKCRRLRGKYECQMMSDLPTDRLQSSLPLTCIGLDVFGPWSVVTRKTRGGVSNSKRWAVLFTCLYTRAIHIEVIEELSSSSFINSLRRFIAIRGSVQEIRSDRGSNFIGATDDLNVNVINVEKKPVADFLLDNKVTWIFNPPHSSHMGGVWERMIGVARRILDSMLIDLHSKHLSHEVLTTLMAEVCAIVNSRPIAPVSSGPENPTILSPNMLLTQKTGEIPMKFGPFTLKDMYKSQWHCVQHLANIFWERWKREYLQTLQLRRKWQNDSPNLCMGDVVLLKDPTTSRNEWPTGIVTNAIKSADGKVRSAEVRIMKEGKPATFTRPISEMVLLIHED
ncbi:uncharacterized protein LOC130048119 [Ostrea edulis]|uniref:uncharacterized protein LOC130048119 n=1 Tax=Ostrea edulis TaxID=37623 RepID=UPI0024AFAA88|nr:uncharacterized protein LOC130048119 [Ostrea edulis]